MIGVGNGCYLSASTGHIKEKNYDAAQLGNRAVLPRRDSYQAPIRSSFAEARKLFEPDLENDHALSESMKRCRRHRIKKLAEELILRAFVHGSNVTR